MENSMPNNNFDNSADTIEQRFENLYPDYDYSLESSYNEKDTRKRKRMKTIY
jgi:hypothetical protein